jgi:hypothetical protein
MSDIALTDIKFQVRPIMSHTPLVLDAKGEPSYHVYDWVWAAQGSGDEAGGVVTAGFDIKDIDPKLQYYHVILAILGYTSAVSEAFVTTKTDQWEIFYVPGHADESVVIFDADRNNRTAPNHQSGNRKIYLGRGRNQDTDGGELSFIYATNTNSAAYNWTVLGATFQNPLPLWTMWGGS